MSSSGKNGKITSIEDELGRADKKSSHQTSRIHSDIPTIEEELGADKTLRSLTTGVTEQQREYTPLNADWIKNDLTKEIETILKRRIDTPFDFDDSQRVMAIQDFLFKDKSVLSEINIEQKGALTKLFEEYNLTEAAKEVKAPQPPTRRKGATTLERAKGKGPAIAARPKKAPPPLPASPPPAVAAKPAVAPPLPSTPPPPIPKKGGAAAKTQFASPAEELAAKFAARQGDATAPTAPHKEQPKGMGEGFAAAREALAASMGANVKKQAAKLPATNAGVDGPPNTPPPLPPQGVKPKTGKENIEVNQQAAAIGAKAKKQAPPVAPKKNGGKGPSKIMPNIHTNFS